MPKKSRNSYLFLRNNGYWQYRRRIPLDLLDTWDANGKRKTEHVVSLRTKDEREARKLAAQQETLFSDKVRLKRQGLVVKGSNHPKRLDAFYLHEHNLRELGIHPDQAPSVNASDAEKKKYTDARDAYIYGSWDTQKQEYIGGLVETQHTVGIDETGPNELYEVIQQDIDFVLGKAVISSSSRVGAPTLYVALEEYISKINAKGFAAIKLQKERQRIERLAKQLAVQLGGGKESTGWSRKLDTIDVRDADLFQGTLIQAGKAKSSVSREMAAVSALYNYALERWRDTWPLHKRDSNPFGKRRSTLEKQHENDTRVGAAITRKRRAFTPVELSNFVNDELPRLNTEARLITMIAAHTGCRLEDASGLLLGDLFIHLDEQHRIPFVCFRDNRLRAVTKDGLEREVPLFGAVLNELTKYTQNRKGSDKPLFPRYGLTDGRGAGNVSNVINARIKNIRGQDVRLTAHSLRHTLQAQFSAAGVRNEYSAYIGGWKNSYSLGLQARYKEDGVPLPPLLEALEKAHTIKDWGRERTTSHWDS